MSQHQAITVSIIGPVFSHLQEQKLKRNVSFKMPQLSEAQEVNGTKETDTTNDTTPDADSSSEVVNKTTAQLEENGITESPRLRKQNENIDVESPPRLLPNSVLQALGLTSSSSEESEP